MNYNKGGKKIQWRVKRKESLPMQCGDCLYLVRHKSKNSNNNKKSMQISPWKKTSYCGQQQVVSQQYQIDRIRKRIDTTHPDTSKKASE